MTGHERRRREKSRQILRAAIELFERFGFRRVTVSEIAERAGVSQVTIYKYFSTKQELVRRSIKEYLLQSAESYVEILRSNRPFVDRLRAVMMDKVATLDRFQGELVAELEAEDPDYVHEIVAERRDMLRTASGPFFDEGRRLGLVRGDLTNTLIVTFFDVIATGVRQSRLYRALESEDRDALEKIQDLAVRAILACPLPADEERG